MQKIVYIFVLFICFSCKTNQTKTSPYIIPKEKLIPLLVDYHLAQGISNTTVFRMRTRNYASLNLSDSVLAAHGYSREQFDSTLFYYSSKINELNDIYEKVITELNKMQTRIEEKRKENTNNSKINNTGNYKNF